MTNERDLLFEELGDSLDHARTMTSHEKQTLGCRAMAEVFRLIIRFHNGAMDMADEIVMPDGVFVTDDVMRAFAKHHGVLDLYEQIHKQEFEIYCKTR